MTAVTALPYGRALTRDDLTSLPDDGHRYGLLDGALIVTPAPSPRHQLASGRIYRLLDDAAPPDMLSPSTRRIDLVLKHDRYRSAGCAAYWVVDPEAPGIRAWRLEGTSYVEAGHAVGDDTLEVAAPFPVRIRPGDLVR